MNMNIIMEEKVKDAKTKIVMNQTTYSYDEAKTKLQCHEWNIEAVILDFMGGSNVQERELSNNQKIFKAFRDLY